MATETKESARGKAGRTAELGPVDSEGLRYSGKRTKTGNSTGFRFEGALFKSHPEFGGRVSAQVIAPGRLLVIAEPGEHDGGEESDPVLASFLAFMAHDMASRPAQIRALDANLRERIDSLVDGVTVRGDEGLGDEELL
jgi:hypothetical protein